MMWFELIVAIAQNFVDSNFLRTTSWTNVFGRFKSVGVVRTIVTPSFVPGLAEGNVAKPVIDPPLGPVGIELHT